MMVGVITRKMTPRFPSDVSGARFSNDRKYRYSLWRIWEPNLPKLVFILLNPSKADEFANDPTVTRCVQRAVTKKFGGVWVLNVFAYRSTNPGVLYELANSGVDPVGIDNDEEISRVVKQNDLSTILCGWGKHGNLLDRGSRVLEILKDFKLHCFGVNGDGTPKHPLYLPYSLEPIVFGDHHGHGHGDDARAATQEKQVCTEPGKGS